MKRTRPLAIFALASLLCAAGGNAVWAEPTYRLILLHKPAGSRDYQTVFSETLPTKGYAMRSASRDGWRWLMQAASGGAAAAYFYLNVDWTKDWPLWGSVWLAHIAVPEKDGLFYGGTAIFANGEEVLLLQRESAQTKPLMPDQAARVAAEGSPALPFDAIATAHRDHTAKVMGRLSAIAPPKKRGTFLSEWKALPGVWEGMDADAAAAAFCVGNVSAGRLADYPEFYATSDKTDFAFRALGKLLAQPARPSVQYGMKLNQVFNFIAVLPPEKITDEDVPVLFEVLRVRPTPMLEPLADWASILKRKAGGFPAFDAALARASKDASPENLGALTAAVEAWEANAKAQAAH